MKQRRSFLWVAATLALAGMLSAFVPPPASGTTMTEADAQGLIYMREEEKLAHDLYLRLYDAYRLPVFARIARSEARHMQVTLDLLRANGLEDPAEGRAAGEFSDPNLQALYDDLLNQALASQAEALRVAALVEEVDIVDLRTRLAATGNLDLTAAYGNLSAASGMHLRAFAGQLERVTGTRYVPQQITADDYAALIGAAGTGRAAGMPGGGSGRMH